MYYGIWCGWWWVVVVWAEMQHVALWVELEIWWSCA